MALVEAGKRSKCPPLRNWKPESSLRSDLLKKYHSHNFRSSTVVNSSANLYFKAYDRGAVENVFSRYMHLHNHFQDEQIKSLWVKRGTPGVHAQ